ncbi:MAG: DinB family protein [Schleiferiaceae bacterium]|nr:DinB family protein [Schleiferiaceae bacterium]
MKFKSNLLIEDLIEHCRKNMNEAQAMSDLPLDILNHKETPEKWSALECLEHLNRYGDFYIPEINNRIKQSRFKADEWFKSGLRGNYFANSVKPREKLNKMNTFTNMNPVGSSLDKTTVDRFIDQQKQKIELLNASREVSLNKVKTAISISKIIKLKLGDTFRVVIYHNERHIVQAKRAIEQVSALSV